MRFGVGILTDLEASHFAQYVRDIEGMGYDNIWIPDERFWRDPYVSMTVCAPVSYTHLDVYKRQEIYIQTPDNR